MWGKASGLQSPLPSTPPSEKRISLLRCSLYFEIIWMYQKYLFKIMQYFALKIGLLQNTRAGFFTVLKSTQ